MWGGWLEMLAVAFGCVTIARLGVSGSLASTLGGRDLILLEAVLEALLSQPLATRKTDDRYPGVNSRVFDVLQRYLHSECSAGTGFALQRY